LASTTRKEQGIETQARSGSREIVSLTSLRGFLATWVVIGHFWQEIRTLLPGLDFLSPWTEHGHSAVPGFFVLSGWVLSHNYREAFRRRETSWIRFLGLRLARIYPVHLAMLAALGALVVGASLAGRPAGAAFGVSALLAQVLLVQAWIPGLAMSWNYPAWSISSEWFAYLLFPFAARADLLFDSKVRALATSVVATLGIVGVIVLWNPLPLIELALVVPCFLAGMGIQALLGHGSGFGRWAPLVASGLLGALAGSCFVPNFLLREFLLAVLPALMVYLLAGRGSAPAGPVWESRPIRILGETSYSLYMVHSIVENVLTKALPPGRLASAGLGARMALVMGWLAATFLATWACYSLIERPARRFVRRRLG